MTTAPTSRPPSLLLCPPPPIPTDSRRRSADTVSTRTTNLTIASTISTGPDTPSTPSHGSFDGVRTPSLPSQASGKVDTKKRNSTLLGFLAVREPSIQALKRYEQEQLRRATAVAREQGRPVTTAALGVSRTKMPASVPKVNSKWDGLPAAVSAPRRGRSRPGDASDRSSTCSGTSGRPSWGPPGSRHGSSDGSDLVRLLTQGHNARPTRRSFWTGPELEGPASSRPWQQSSLSTSTASSSSRPSWSSRPELTLASSSSASTPTMDPEGHEPPDGHRSDRLDEGAPAVVTRPPTRGGVPLAQVPEDVSTETVPSTPTSMPQPATSGDVVSCIHDVSDVRSGPSPRLASMPEPGTSPEPSRRSGALRSRWRAF